VGDQTPHPCDGCYRGGVAAQAANAGFRQARHHRDTLSLRLRGPIPKLTGAASGALRRTPRNGAEIKSLISRGWLPAFFRPEAIACFQRVMGRMKDEGLTRCAGVH